jgi:hypothetical protein
MSLGETDQHNIEDHENDDERRTQMAAKSIHRQRTSRRGWLDNDRR